MLCRNEEKDPRKCLAEGRAVTACSLEFFRKVKKSCASEFTQYANCLDRSSTDFSFAPYKLFFYSQPLNRIIIITNFTDVAKHRPCLTNAPWTIWTLSGRTSATSPRWKCTTRNGHDHLASWSLPISRTGRTHCRTTNLVPRPSLATASPSSIKRWPAWNSARCQVRRWVSSSSARRWSSVQIV